LSYKALFSQSTVGAPAVVLSKALIQSTFEIEPGLVSVPLMVFIPPVDPDTTNDPVTANVDPLNVKLPSPFNSGVVPVAVTNLLSTLVPPLNVAPPPPDNKFVPTPPAHAVKSIYAPLAAPPCSKNRILFW
jgi:hypothetical protein